MPVDTSKSPGYRKHTTRHLAVVTLSDAVTRKRKSHYLGEYGPPSSRERYHRLIAQWEASGRCLPSETAREEPRDRSSPSISVGTLILEYWRWAKTCHGHSEQGCIRIALRLLREMYGSSPADQLGPSKLRLVRDAMIHGDRNATPPRKPWARKSVNKQIHRITAMFKWAASREILPVSVYQCLKTLEPLKRGRTTAAEGELIKPVSPEIVEATRPFLSQQISALIDPQRSLNPARQFTPHGTGVALGAPGVHAEEHVQR